MLWIFASLFFFWLACREIKGALIPRAGFDRPEPIFMPYLVICMVLAIAFALPPVRYWRFEQFLAAKATELADSNPAQVHCNTVFDTMFDREVFAAGHADFENGQIVFQHPWCGILMDYLDHPERATLKELASLNLLTHESMHVRGERNEAKTECQAVQRNYRAAKVLGVDDAVARQNALAYYYDGYLSRRGQGPFSSQYFSEQCAPGKALDEHLTDSTWLAKDPD